MKKVLTITCHNVYNHGATLQEYALLQFLKNRGYDAATINYRPPFLSNHFKLTQVNPKFEKNIVLKTAYLALKLPVRLLGLKRKKNFDAFEAKNIKVTHQVYTSNEELKANIPPADIYICGSDQIWNSFFENGKDPAFYLDFVPENKLKISYAASFAIDEIAEDLKPFVREMVGKIDHVSVREVSGLRIVENLGINNATRVLDPVFLLDPKYWSDTFVKPIKEKYIFIYDFDSNEGIRKMAQREAKKHNLKIFTVNKNIKYADSNFEMEAPDKFISLVYHAEFVITNSFHALAFSLIFNKKFFVVNRTDKINTRMRDMLELVGLSELLIGSNDNKAFDEVKIDYKVVNEKLASERQKSAAFLTSALEDKRYDTKN